ncbi:HIRAN domain-containing protein [Echinicola marina]|uniref:HIRAN domain-containing protein n=1 Tax=Echinicola marina TaxID=2859768 RepID=UPI001CF66A17|nr:HIRAN domain-containing protein [Echinicola marina]UCS91858.1 HIRAN domain-containing protein [Echinicola marina]
MKIDRKEFLKVIGLGSANLILPPLAAQPNYNPHLLSQSIKIYDNYIKGVQYYDLGKCMKLIKPGDKVGLKRFADHKYDRFAIGVEWEKYFLGYLPAYENIVLANLMDAGGKLEGMITSKGSIYEVSIGIWTEIIINSNAATSEKLNELPADKVDDIYRSNNFYDIKVR